MEVRLKKMEMTVSVCHFYDLFFLFFFIATSFHIITLTQYLWTNAIDSGRNFVRSLKSFVCSQLVVASVYSHYFLAILNVYMSCRHTYTVLV